VLPAPEDQVQPLPDRPSYRTVPSQRKKHRAQQPPRVRHGIALLAWLVPSSGFTTVYTLPSATAWRSCSGGLVPLTPPALSWPLVLVPCLLPLLNACRIQKSTLPPGSCLVALNHCLRESLITLPESHELFGCPAPSQHSQCHLHRLPPSNKRHLHPGPTSVLTKGSVQEEEERRTKEEEQRS
jgi:hypothetical protein